MARSCAGDMEIYSSIISEAVGGIIGGIRMMNFYFLFQSGGWGWGGGEAKCIASLRCNYQIVLPTYLQPTNTKGKELMFRNLNSIFKQGSLYIHKVYKTINQALT